MRYRIVVIILLLTHCNLIKALKNKEENYRLNTERHFKRQCFDSCLYFQYLLTNKHVREHDSINLVKDWYFTAWINILQEKYAQAGAARILAKTYGKRHTGFFENVYMGLYYYKQEAYKKALPYLKNTAENNNSGYPYITNLIRVFLVNRERELKSDDKSITEAEKLLANLKLASDTMWFGYALAKKNLGMFLYKEDQLQASIQCFEGAAGIYEQLKIYNKDLTDCYKFLMNVSRRSNRMDLCDAYFMKLEGFFQKIDSETLPYYYFLKGYMFFSKNQHKEALNVYLKAFSYIKILPKDDYDALSNLLLLYFRLNQYEKVIEWCEKLQPVEKEDIALLLAYSYYQTGNKQKAFKLLDQARESFTYINLHSYFLICNYCFRIIPGKEAEYYLKTSSKKILKKYGKVGYRASLAYGVLGYYYWYGKSDYKKSLYYYHQQINSLVTGKYCSDYYSLPDAAKSINDEELSKAINNKAEAFYEVSKLRKNKAEALRDLQAGLANLELSLQIAHRFKISIPSDEKKYEYANYIRHRYPFIIKICLELYQKTGNRLYADKAFEYTEKSKASVLLSTMRGADASAMHLIPGNLRETEDRLWNKIELTSRYLYWNYNSLKPDINAIDKLNSELYALKKQQDSLICLYKQKYPAYYKIKFDNEVIGAEQLQQKLKPNEVLLQYSLSPDRIVIFYVSPKEFKVFSDSVTPRFYADLKYYWKFTAEYSDYNCLDTAIRSFEKRSNALYNVLIKPVEPHIAGKHLIVVPDGPLTQISFDALVSRINNCHGFQCMSFLVKENTISYEYSGTLYALNQGSGYITNPKLLAMAPRYDNQKIKNIPGKEWASLQNDSAELATIPGTYEEIKSICKSFNGRAVIKSRATEKKFKSIAGNYDILHLAMHGVVNNEMPMLSKLIFTPVNDSVNEGLLNTYEIFDLKINAQMVVLSACNTGSGKLYKGEGVMSMARAFYTSGAKSVVMTLWPVADKTSSNLISIFYNKLALRQNIGNALRQAKIEYLANTDEISAHPSFWAGYMVTGNSEIVFGTPKAKNKITIWITLAGMLILVLLLFRKKI